MTLEFLTAFLPKCQSQVLSLEWSSVVMCLMVVHCVSNDRKRMKSPTVLVLCNVSSFEFWQKIIHALKMQFERMFGFCYVGLWLQSLCSKWQKKEVFKSAVSSVIQKTEKFLNQALLAVALWFLVWVNFGWSCVATHDRKMMVELLVWWWLCGFGQKKWNANSKDELGGCLMAPQCDRKWMENSASSKAMLSYLMFFWSRSWKVQEEVFGEWVYNGSVVWWC